MIKNNILFTTYFFDSSDGVGSSRSMSLAQFLEQNGFKLTVLSSKTWNKNTNKITLVWGIKCAVYIIRNKINFNKIYISCGPFMPLLPIIFIAKLLNKPVIVDFRDAWSLNIATNYGREAKKMPLRNKVKLIFSRLIEKYMYKNCQYFLVCTQGMKDEYTNLFKDDSKIKLVTNGYDFKPLSYKNSRLNNTSNITKYVCLGKFAEYGENKAFQCLKKIKENHIDGSPFCIDFIGTNKDICDPLIKQLHLQYNVIFHKPLPYNQALQLAASADFGISIIRNEKLDYGTKVFDYIGLGLPIFDVFEEGSNFRNYFAEYITDNKEEYSISLEKLKEFQRSEIFSRNIDIFKENKHENSISSWA